MKKAFFTILFALSVAGSAFAAQIIKAGSANNLKDVAACPLTGVTGQNVETEIVNIDDFKAENQLPVQAKRTFAKMFEGYKITQTIHFVENKSEGFYISAENEKESIIVKIDQDLDISIFKQIKNRH